MGRRSDHTRAELTALIVRVGHALLAECGFARFSAREVAKRVGYTVGTIYNVFGSHDQLMLAINGHTLDQWREHLAARLAEPRSEPGGDRLQRAIAAYFEFATANRHTWTALYDFHMPEGAPLPDFYAEKLAAITAIIVTEIAAALPETRRGEAPVLAPSLLATVHGHCFFALNGTWRLLGGGDPLAAVLARVRAALGPAST